MDNELTDADEVVIDVLLYEMLIGAMRQSRKWGVPVEIGCGEEHDAVMLLVGERYERDGEKFQFALDMAAVVRDAWEKTRHEIVQHLAMDSGVCSTPGEARVASAPAVPASELTRDRGMARADLFTDTGGFVAAFDVPYWVKAVEVVRWADRLFRLAYHDLDTGYCQYQEGVLWPLGTPGRGPRDDVAAWRPLMGHAPERGQEPRSNPERADGLPLDCPVVALGINQSTRTLFFMCHDGELKTVCEEALSSNRMGSQGSIMCHLFGGDLTWVRERWDLESGAGMKAAAQALVDACYRVQGV